MNRKDIVRIVCVCLSLFCCVQAKAADLVVNPGASAASNEAGIAFQITNTNTTATLRLRGLFMLATNGGEPQAFNLFYAAGNAGFVDGTFGLAIAGGPAWTRLGTATPAYMENSSEPGNPLTLLNFGQPLDIAPGQTMTLAIIQQQPSIKIVKYTKNLNNYVPKDGLILTPYRGLGSAIAKPEVSDLTDANFNLQQFGNGLQSPADYRGFIGSINYILVPKQATP